MDTSFVGNSDEESGNNSSIEYNDFTVEDPRGANKSGEADFERREKERLSKERENMTMQQKKKEMMERQQQMQMKAQAAREPPSSHHFKAANNSGGGDGASAPERQGAVIKKGSMARRPRPNPNTNAKTSPRRSQVDREAQEKEQQHQMMGVQGHGSSGGMPGATSSNNSSMGSIPPGGPGNGGGNSSGSNLLGLALVEEGASSPTQPVCAQQLGVQGGRRLGAPAEPTKGPSAQLQHWQHQQHQQLQNRERQNMSPS